MKNTPKKKCKKKWTPNSGCKGIEGKAASNPYQNKNVLRRLRTLRPRNTSALKHALTHMNYIFKITPEVSSYIRAIKRTIIVNLTEAPNTSHISISDRIRARGIFVGKNYNIQHSRDFVESRYFNMGDSAANSRNADGSFPRISITFEHMLRIRKKRLERKYGGGSFKTPDFIVNQISTAVGANGQNDCVEIVDLDATYDSVNVIEIKDDSHIVIDCENNILEKTEIEPIKSLEEIKIMNETTQPDEKNPSITKVEDVAPLHSVPDSIALSEQAQNEMLVDYDSNHFIIIDETNPVPLSPTKAEDVSSKPNQDILNLDSVTIRDAITLSEILVEDITNQPISSSQNEPAQAKTPPRPRWPSSESIIALSDSSVLCHDVSDDIIFVESHSPAKQRKMDRKPSVVIVEDDDSSRPQYTINSPRNGKKKRMRKKNYNRIKKRKKKFISEQRRDLIKATCDAIPSSSTAGSERAEENCVNTANHNQASRTLRLQLRRMARLEKSITVAQTNDQESRSKPINRFGSNIYNTGRVIREGLRQIVIDGSNIAIGHANGTAFSVEGLQIAIDYFIKKGHKVKAFVPQFRLKTNQCTNRALLNRLVVKRLVILTPSREVNGRRITPYDDRYIIQYAETCEGIVVSNDNYRDLLAEKPEWRDTIENRLLMYTWVDDILIFPEDPLGRRGPNLSRFLRFP